MHVKIVDYPRFRSLGDIYNGLCVFKIAKAFVSREISLFPYVFPFLAEKVDLEVGHLVKISAKKARM